MLNRFCSFCSVNNNRSLCGNTKLSSVSFAGICFCVNQWASLIVCDRASRLSACMLSSCLSLFYCQVPTAGLHCSIKASWSWTTRDKVSPDFQAYINVDSVRKYIGKSKGLELFAGTLWGYLSSITDVSFLGVHIWNGQSLPSSLCWVDVTAVPETILLLMWPRFLWFLSSSSLSVTDSSMMQMHVMYWGFFDCTVHPCPFKEGFESRA